MSRRIDEARALAARLEALLRENEEERRELQKMADRAMQRQPAKVSKRPKRSRLYRHIVDIILDNPGAKAGKIIALLNLQGNGVTRAHLHFLLNHLLEMGVLERVKASYSIAPAWAEKGASAIREFIYQRKGDSHEEV